MLPAKRSWLLYRAAALSACLEPIAGEWAVIKLTYEPRDFWTVLQEIGIDFALGAELLGGFGGCCPLSASLTWGNAGVLWRFGLVRPAKPPRSCKQSSLYRRWSDLGIRHTGRVLWKSKESETQRIPVEGVVVS